MDGHLQPPLRIAVDASWFGPTARGMARHAMMLLRSELVAPVLLNTRGAPKTGPPKLAQPIFEQVRFHRLARRHHANACLSPYNTGPLFPNPSLLQVTVVHDLIYLQPRREAAGRGTRRQALGRTYRALVVPRAARLASVVVTVSELMKHELIERFGLKPERVFVVPNAAEDELFQPYSVQLGDTVRLLAVSGTAPHKNLGRLLACTDQLMSEDIPLEVVVVGVAPPDGADLMRAFDADHHRAAFRFLKGLSREELRDQYRNASCFVMPSLEEGFGIPLLEALAAGLPCGASDIRIFREMAGPDCTYFDPASPADILAATRRLVEGLSPALGCRVERRPSLSTLRYSASRVSETVDDFWRTLIAF